MPGWRGLRVFASAIVLTVAGAGSGGCSMSYQLGSLFGKDDDKVAAADKPEVTGALKASPAAAHAEENASISEADIAAASAAAMKMLASGAKSTSVPWQNPQTGARGMVTPLQSVYPQDGTTCRDFLASIVREEAEAWLQGEACKGAGGQWTVRNLKPWKRA